MQNKNELAENLAELFNPSSYKEFGEGYFVNQPRMTGYYFIFKDITKPCFCLILNTSQEVKYPTSFSKIADYVYIVFNIPSLEEYLNSFASDYLPTLLTIIDENILKKNPRNLPYGYYTDLDGQIKVDLRKAQEVRRIYQMYIDTQSIRHIATTLSTNFSHIRDVLASNEEYMQMQEKIVPVSKLQEVNGLLAENVKGRFKIQTSSGETEELRRQRKQKIRAAKAAAQ